MVYMPDRHQAAKWMPVLLWGGLAMSLLAVALLLLSGRAQQQERNYRTHLAELTVLAGGLPAQAAAAGHGDDVAFGKLVASRSRLEQLLAEGGGGRALHLPHGPASVRGAGATNPAGARYWRPRARCWRAAMPPMN